MKKAVILRIEGNAQDVKELSERALEILEDLAGDYYDHLDCVVDTAQGEIEPDEELFG